ncbi:MAG: polysaccharide biosynthesis tyrosine autokinase [Nitrospirae bacterium]|nr:polysaccharide biosynthesis tyrosine autokinase [Nitrospirota bacterium]
MARREAATSLPDILRVVIKRKYIVLMCFVLSGMVAAFFLRGQQELFRTHASVEVEQFYEMRNGFGFNFTDFETERNIITSLPVVFEVAQRLGRVPESLGLEEAGRDSAVLADLRRIQSLISPEQRGSTTIVDIHVTSPEAMEARDVANFTAYAYRSHRNLRSHERVEQAREVGRSYRERLEELLGQAEKELSNFKLERRVTEAQAAMDVQLNRQVEVEEQGAELSRRAEVYRQMLSSLGAEPGEAAAAPAVLATADPSAIERLRENYLALQVERDEARSMLAVAHPRLQELDERMTALRGRLVGTIGMLLEEIGRHREQLEAERAAIESARHNFLKDEIELVRLRRKVDRYQSMLEQTEQSLQTVEFQESYRGEHVRVVEMAVLPTEPMTRLRLGPTVPILLLGLVMGIGLAFLREAFDFSMEDISEAEHVVGLPVLSVIPHFDAEQAEARQGRRPPPKGNGAELPYFRSKMIAHFWPKNPTSESFRMLRMAIRRGTEGPRVFLVTSATPQEGKSFITSNLAITFAQANYSTLLIEANTRRPTMHKIFPIKHDQGLTSAVSDAVVWRDQIRGVHDFILEGLDPKSIQDAPGLENLRLLPAGQTPVHPSETLMQLMDRNLIGQARKEFEIVIIDCPPILPVADASVLAPHVDGVILVYRMGRTPRDMLMRAIETIRGVKGNIMGMVLNDVDYQGPSFYPRYLYRYQYRGYTPEADRASVPFWKRWRLGGAPDHQAPAVASADQDVGANPA